MISLTSLIRAFLVNRSTRWTKLGILLVGWALTSHTGESTEGPEKFGFSQPESRSLKSAAVYEFGFLRTGQ
jgi:hypothetical protein